MTVHEALSRLLSAELSAEEERTLRTRIETEPAVRRAWEEMQRLPSALAALPVEAAPPDLDRRVLSVAERPAVHAWRGSWLIAAAAALLLGVLAPRPAARISIESGSELVDGRVDVRVAGVDVDVDGRARISLEPDASSPRAMRVEATDMKSVLAGGAVGAMITIAVYEGRARIADDHGAGLVVGAGETRSVPATVAAPGVPRSTNEAELRAQVDSLQEELDRVRFEQSLAKGQLARHEGKPQEFPADLPDVLRPAGFEPAMKDLVAGIDGASLLSVDCSEYPCVALVEFADEGGLKRSGLESGLGSQWGLVDPGVSVWASNVRSDDGAVYLAALTVYPSEDDGRDDSEQGTRTKFRVDNLFRETQSERLEDPPE
jgi:hypothetical protein